MKKLLSIVIISIAYSCSYVNHNCGSRAKFQIKNRSQDSIALEITASQNLAIKARLTGEDETKDAILCMDNEPKNEDGTYSIHVKGAMFDTVARAGYYSNGSASAGTIQVIIYKDRIKISESITK